MKQIPLKTKSGPPLFALVDDEDYEMLSQYSWYPLHSERSYYARTHIKNDEGMWKTVLMHRLILGLTNGERGPDHKNRKGWDNRRQNLDMENNSAHDQMINRSNWGKSKYNGVSFYPANESNRRKSDKWVAVYYDGKTASGNPRQKRIGYFDTEIEAAVAYDDEMIRIGRHTKVNFPQDNP